ncbi:hypothetical protein OIU85_021990 [Salix viminalis]|uniref:Uncharacterized protein n=1 Tax=Salix viminalis TaxID=40686 RepID=A0A9Q0UJI6_SALVM|nr:hypothetical protein OIU85_021990 [Salix viminalis]
MKSARARQPPESSRPGPSQAEGPRPQGFAGPRSLGLQSKCQGRNSREGFQAQAQAQGRRPRGPKCPRLRAQADA